MKRTPKVTELVFAIVVVVAAIMGRAAPAHAQANAGTVAASAGGAGGAGIGVGASAFLSGFTGAQLVYDTTKWHIEALTAFDTRHVGGGMNPPRITSFDFAVSGWYHLHLGASSDFSLGGGFALVTQNGGGQSLTSEIVEPGAEIRAFVTPNVALHATIAFPIVFGDNIGPNATTSGTASSFGFTGQILGSFGFTYFFR